MILKTILKFDEHFLSTKNKKYLKLKIKILETCYQLLINF